MKAPRTEDEETERTEDPRRMRLSEAILLGSSLRPSSRKVWITATGSCAVGAALEAIGQHRQYLAVYAGAYDGTAKGIHTLKVLFDGGADRWNGPAKFTKAWPWTRHWAVSCPVCGHGLVVCKMMTHLHGGASEDHQWSRQRIAAWVATIEPHDPRREPAEDTRTAEARP